MPLGVVTSFSTHKQPRGGLQGVVLMRQLSTKLMLV